MPTITETLRCTGCGMELAHDREAERWLRRPVLYAPDMVDGTPDGRCDGDRCPATGDDHTPTTSR